MSKGAWRWFHGLRCKKCRILNNFVVENLIKSKLKIQEKLPCSWYFWQVVKNMRRILWRDFVIFRPKVYEISNIELFFVI